MTLKVREGHTNPEPVIAAEYLFGFTPATELVTWILANGGLAKIDITFGYESRVLGSSQHPVYTEMLYLFVDSNWVLVPVGYWIIKSDGKFNMHTNGVAIHRFNINTTKEA